MKLHSLFNKNCDLAKNSKKILKKFKIMTYSQEEINQIITLRENNIPWSTIGQLLNKNPANLRKWYSKYKFNSTLPKKIKVDNSKTSGRIGLQIKKITQDNPKITIRDTSVELQKLNPSKTDLPTTIHNFFSKIQLQNNQIIKKPLFSIKNQIKRVEFATKNLKI